MNAPIQFKFLRLFEKVGEIWIAIFTHGGDTTCLTVKVGKIGYDKKFIGEKSYFCRFVTPTKVFEISIDLDFNRSLFSNYRPLTAPIKNKRSAHTERKNNMAIPCHLFSITW